MDDADQVGGEGEVHRLWVGGHVEVEQQQDKEDQVEVEVEALQQPKIFNKYFRSKTFDKRKYPRCKSKVGQ